MLIFLSLVLVFAGVTAPLSLHAQNTTPSQHEISQASASSSSNQQTSSPTEASAKEIPQISTPPQPSLNEQLHVWGATLQLMERYVENAHPSLIKFNEYRDRLNSIEGHVQVALADQKASLTKIDVLLDTLGPKPETEEEAPSIILKRTALTDQKNQTTVYIAHLQLLTQSISNLRAQMKILERGFIIQSLLQRTPPLLSFTTMGQAATEAYLNTRHTFEYFTKTPQVAWKAFIRDILSLRFFLYAFVFSLAFALSRFFIRHIQRKIAEQEDGTPSTTQRLYLATSHFFGRVFLSCLAITLLWLFFSQASLSPYSDIASLLRNIALFCLVLLPSLFFLNLIFPTQNEHAWDFFPSTLRHANALKRYLFLLIYLIAFDVFFISSLSSLHLDHEALLAWGNFVFGIIALALLYKLTAPSSWETGTDDETETEPAQSSGTLSGQEAHDDTLQNEQGAPTLLLSRQKWHLLRLILSIAIFFGLTSQILGYGFLGGYIVRSLTASFIMTLAFVFCGSLAYAWILRALSSRVTKRFLGMSAKGETAFKFWLTGTLYVISFLIWLFIATLIWHVPAKTTWLEIASIPHTLKVGNVTISFSDLALGLIFFASTLFIFRLLRRLLEEKIMPQLSLDAGVRYSIIAVFRYTALVVAALLAVRIMGMDLKGLYVIAGALLVGIGFGLQNIANNFISGLILLFERPIKIGDTIQLKSNGVEIFGTVSRIRARATEVITFQESEITIPNADVLSNAVTNWTHSNRHARIEILISVSYGSDTRLVHDLLLKIANDHPQVLKRPAPIVLFKDFGQSSLSFELRFFIPDVDAILVVGSQIRFDIDHVFRENGIEMPFPQRTVSFSTRSEKLFSDMMNLKRAAEEGSAQENAAHDPNAKALGVKNPGSSPKEDAM